MNIQLSARASFLAALGLFAATGCETLPQSTGSPTSQASEDAASGQARKGAAEEAQKKREARAKELKDLEAKLVKLARKRTTVERELEIAIQKASDDRDASALGVASAERELRTAQVALAGFETFTQPLARAESKLSVDRAKRRLGDAQDELKEILILYEDEIDAVRAKEIVVARHQSSVEFAERSLDIANMKAKQSEEKTLAEQREKLEHGVKQAGDSLAKALADSRRQEMSAALERMRKEHAILEVAEDVADTETEIEKLKRAADDAEAGNGDGPPAKSASD